MATIERTIIPWAWYSDPEIYRLEQERIFGRTWQYVARLDQVAEPGQLVTGRAGQVPIVVARARDGVLRAFVNVCRHRGHILCEGEERRETIQCPYHAWTYGLDGTLRRAPRADGQPGFDAGALSLLPVSVDTWGPFVFVNPDAEAAPLAETLGELPQLVAAAGVDVDTLVFHSRSGREYEANWKVCVENYLECYHCQIAHPGFAQVMDTSEDAYLLEQSRLYSSQYGPVKGAQPGGFDPSGEVPRGEFHMLFPGTPINILPGHPNISIGPIVPLAPERTHRWLDYFFAPDTPADWIEEMLAFDTQVGIEDTSLVESVQAGVRSGAVESGVLVRSETLIGHFQRLVADALAP